MSGSLKVTDSVSIPRHEIEMSFSASGGPGGQHANKAATRVDLVLDLVNCSGLSYEQRQRVVNKLGAELRVSADDHRSQIRNREIAEKRLADKLRAALVTVRRRKKTRPTRGSQRRRLAAKRRTSELKQQRRRPRRGDDM